MGIRVVLAALIGGAAMFGASFAEHVFLGWVGRQMKLPGALNSAARDIKRHFTAPGIYGYPPMPPDLDKLTPEEQQKARAKVEEEYKTGPAAIVVVAPPGEDMVGPVQLGGEFASNVLAVFLAAAIIGLLRPDVGFAGRWAAAFLIGLICWLSVNASYFLFFRFPWPWVQDELYCTMLEWGAAGFFIALIVRPKAVVASLPADKIAPVHTI